MTELSRAKRMAYGIAGVTMNLPDQILMQWLLIRYVPPDAAPLLPPKLFGIIVMMCSFAGAVENPIVGHWSDEARTGWGRRLPFLRIGIIPFVIVYVLLFSPPFAGMSWLNVVWVFATLNVYFIAYAIIVNPYLALLPELTFDLKERVDLATYQSVGIVIGTFIFAGMGAVLENWGWPVLVGVTAIIILVCYVPLCTMIREKPLPAVRTHEPLHLLHSIRLSLQNQPFRCVLGSNALFWFGLNGIVVITPIWVVSYLGRDEGVVSQILGAFILVNLVSFFAFNALAHRLGKYALMQVTFVSGGLIMLAFALIGRFPIGSEFTQTLILVSAFGIPAAGFMVLPFAILSDVVDHDEQVTGRRREALYFGVLNMVQRSMVGISLLTFTIVPYIGGDGAETLREGGGLRFTGEYTRVGKVTSVAALAGGESEGRQPGSATVVPEPAEIDAAWTLSGPNGFTHEGHGEEIVSNLRTGAYSVSWHSVSGWKSPEPPHAPTPLGLKLMTVLCGLFCLGGALAFLRYPIRERDGKAYFVGAN